MITSAHYTLAIIMMAIITFSIRYAFFTTSFEIKLHPRIKKLLVFTAPCILTAMFVPIMFQGNLDSSADTGILNSSYFWASLVAIGLSLALRQTLLVILASLAAFYFMRYLGLS